ncbi:MAG: PKD domain-containing protein [Bacteroidia bacterium]
MLFVSGRYNSMGVVYANDSEEITDLFSVKKTDSIHFGKVKPLEAELNTKFNEGPFTLNKAGDVIYFTGSNNFRQLKIFCSKKINGKWSKPEALPFCYDGYAYCHPSLSGDESTLYFSSNMPLGNGGMDLYMTVFKNGAWTRPVNLGNTVNSEANEVFPFIAAKNHLYFSSNRPGGLGELDIYSVDLKEHSYPKHYNKPLNSPYDDFGVWVDTTLDRGYFSTNRIQKQKDDIYMFHNWIPDFSDSRKPPVKTSFCYTFFEESSANIKDTSHLTYEWSFGDGTKTRSLKTRHCFTRPGDYVIQLNIIEKVSGQIFQSEASYILTVDPPEQLHIDCGDTVLAGKEIIINSSKSALKGYDIHKMYWSFGDGKYNDGALVKHNYKKEGAYTLELWVEAKNKATFQSEKFRAEKQIIVKNKN